MKYSKVNHTKAAVGLTRNNKGIGGMLYTDPASVEESVQTLNKRFEDLNGNAKRLYNIFNQVQNGKAPSFIYGRNGINRTLRETLFVKGMSTRGIKGVDDVLKYVKKLNKLSEEDIYNCVPRYLRKSLRKEQEGLRILLRLFGHKDPVKKEDKERVQKFLSLLEKDIQKIEFAKRVIKSVENQNMPVQPVKEEDAVCFLLSKGKSGLEASKDPDRNQREKEGMKNIVLRFADLNQNNRNDVLRKIRNILDVYFSTPKVFVDEKNIAGEAKIPDIINNRTIDFNVWDAHQEGKANTEEFADLSNLIKEEKLSNLQTDWAKKSELHSTIRKRNLNCYLYTKAVVYDDRSGLFFSDPRANDFIIHHIENSIERLLRTVDFLSVYKNNVGYLREKVWKDLVGYFCTKYIAIGKAVFNFGMDDLYINNNVDKELGTVSEKIKEGITSFDYEQIKANETFQRELAVAVSFAANNLARATIAISEENEDLLLLDKEQMMKNRLHCEEGGTLLAVLQFFGGRSSWDEDLFRNAYTDNKKISYEIQFLNDVKNNVYALRNVSFHFKTVGEEQGWNKELIGIMFEKEAATCIENEKIKFYSNNLDMFYEAADLRKVLDLLYAKTVTRGSQVPSYNSVIVRTQFSDYLRVLFKKRERVMPNFSDIIEAEKWRNAVYYILKEIYYNDFLSTENSKKMFFDALDDRIKDTKIVDGKKDLKRKMATEDFSKRCKTLQNYSLPEICQYIMTEYNAQNAGDRKVKSNAAERNKPAIFQHYKMLLLKTMADAFAKFLTVKEEYAFLFDTEKIFTRNKGAQDEFLHGWHSKRYDNLVECVKGSENLQKWYVTGRLLNGKTLNHLLGSMRSYIQYLEDVKRRATETGNSLIYEDDIKGNVDYIKEAISVVEVCIKLSSVYSNTLTDYFSDEEEYAKYLASYLEYIDLEGVSFVSKLDHFCNVSELDSLGIYMDGKRPIVNRNVVMSKLYGPSQILGDVLTPVKQEKLISYYNNRKRIAEYRKKGYCTNKGDQQALLNFQRMKNSIEFRDVVEFGELVNELLGQLINWSYLRERDMMYFQLGFHYMCLLNDRAEKPQKYCELHVGNGNVIKNGILHQIAAMYIFGLDVYSGDEKKDKQLKRGLQTSSKIKKFCRSYSENALINSERLLNANNVPPKEILYTAGLELFENLNKHEEIIDLRNKIDHFKYYSGKAGSILELYSDVFNKFFTHDEKLRKTVATMLANILLKHCVIIRPGFGTQKLLDPASGESKQTAKIEIEHVSADQYTYKIGDNGNEICTLPARSEEYLQTIVKLLYYPQNQDSGIEVDSEFKAFVNKTEGRKVYFRYGIEKTIEYGSVTIGDMKKEDIKKVFVKNKEIIVRCVKKAEGEEKPKWEIKEIP